MKYPFYGVLDCFGYFLTRPIDPGSNPLRTDMIELSATFARLDDAVSFAKVAGAKGSPYTIKRFDLDGEIVTQVNSDV